MREEIVLPFYGVSFEKQFEVLKGFYIKSKKREAELSYKDVSEIVKLTPANTSGCIKFYESIGLFIKGSKRGNYTPSEVLCDFFVTLSYAEQVKEKEAEAKSILHKQFEDIWFTKQILQHFEMHEISDEMNLLISLAKKAKVELDNHNKKSFMIILDWLSYLNFIEKDETGNYKLYKDGRKIEMLSKKISEEEVESISPRGVIKAKEYKYTINFAITVTPETTKEELEKMIKLVKEYIEEKTGE